MTFVVNIEVRAYLKGFILVEASTLTKLLQLLEMLCQWTSWRFMTLLNTIIVLGLRNYFIIVSQYNANILLY